DLIDRAYDRTEFSPRRSLTRFVFFVILVVNYMKGNHPCSITYRSAFATSRRPRRFTTRRSSRWGSVASVLTRRRWATAKRRPLLGQCGGTPGSRRSQVRTTFLLRR